MMATARNWRRTSFKRLDGSIDVAPDDWTLFDDNGRQIARIYHYGFGPNAGRWAWFVLIGPDGAPANGGTGVAETGREARETCERLLPPGTNELLHARGGERCRPVAYPRCNALAAAFTLYSSHKLQHDVKSEFV